MIHYHGTPVSGKRQDVITLMSGRHGLVPFPRKDDLGAVADVCQSFVFDNGAFSIWKKGGVLDTQGYYRWVEDWCRHPGFDWALIPDVIDGTEVENDLLISEWPEHLPGVPVWHLHESLSRLNALSSRFKTVALGSSGEWRTPGTKAWWRRMQDALTAVCDVEGRPRCRLHGLRMLNPKVFSRMPLASADSTNASMNGGSLDRFGMYAPPTAGQRARVIADRIERHNSSPIWRPFLPEDPMTIYLTPCDRVTREATGPSEDCGLPDLASAVEMFGDEWVNWHPRCITYPDFAISDFVIRLEP